MNPAKIVVGKIQAESGVKVVPFLAESIRQARKSANRGSHAEVRTLND